MNPKLQKEIIKFLMTVPNLDDGGRQRALINFAGLDERLQCQILFDRSLIDFILLLLPTLINYGRLDDGRSALEAVLEATKDFVGLDRREVCDTLIVKIKDWYHEIEIKAEREINRAEMIIESIEEFLKRDYKSGEKVTVRMRAAFTSMSNIQYHIDKKHPDLSIPQKDKLLVEERECIRNLLAIKEVTLKCICWPRLHFLGYYSDEQLRERVKLLDLFLKESLLEHNLTRRKVLCDRVGGKGNLLIIGHKTAIVARPESIEYRHTLVFDDPQFVDVLIREYDILFKRILQARKFDRLESEIECHRALLDDAMLMLSQEVKQWEREKDDAMIMLSEEIKQWEKEKKALKL